MTINGVSLGAGNRTSGQYVLVGRGDVSYWAFVPAPLPPRIRQSRQLTYTRQKAERAIRKLNALIEEIPYPYPFAELFIRQEAVYSSLIEDIRASIADLYVYEAQRREKKSALDLSDASCVLGCADAIRYGVERIASLPISLRLVRELHAVLFAKTCGAIVPGEFRRTQNWIGPPGCTLKNAVYVPPPVSYMHEALDSLEKYIHNPPDPYAPLVRLPLIHYQFEAIHPFVDGNGRVGRILVLLLLVDWGLLSLPVLCLSAYLYRHRQDYYRLLLSVSKNGDWENWILFFLQGVAEQAQKSLVCINRLEKLRQGIRKRLPASVCSDATFRFIDLVFSYPIFSVSQMAELLHADYNTVTELVKALDRTGLLSSYPRLGGEGYWAPEVVDIIRAQ